MDAPPINKLLQLLRQKPAEPVDESPLAQAIPSRPKRRATRVLDSGVQPATGNGIQAATNDTQCAIAENLDVLSSGTQCATLSGIQPAMSSIQSAPHRSTPYPVMSSTQYATGSDVPLAFPDLSKGQRRALQFLVANRDLNEPSRTVPIGYHAISTYCFLSRNGSRKVIEELCKKSLIKRIATHRGGMQGSIYVLNSSIQPATMNSIPEPANGPEESSPQYATPAPSCSSKKLLLQELVLEDAFHNLNPRSLSNCA